MIPALATENDKMSNTVYSEINLHLTWHVKLNDPVLRDEIANRKVLEWQDGLGVVSFGTKDIPWVATYVRNQRKHHGDGTTQDRLERTDPPQEEEEKGDG